LLNPQSAQWCHRPVSGFVDGSTRHVYNTEQAVDSGAQGCQYCK